MFSSGVDLRIISGIGRTETPHAGTHWPTRQLPIIARLDAYSKAARNVFPTAPASSKKLPRSVIAGALLAASIEKKWLQRIMVF
jgi:hypothetical protein